MKALIFLLIMIMLMVCIVVGTNNVTISKKDNKFAVESKR